MISYDHSDPDPDRLRAHPWTEAEVDSSHRYYDLKETPALIRTSLEDYRPWDTWPAIETFYRLLEWLNGTESLLESNDCAFKGPSANKSPQCTKTLEATGRLMVLWRRLPWNLSRERVVWLKEATHHYMKQIDPDFCLGVLGIHLFQSRYISLPLPEERQDGYQLTLSFWSWGDTEEEAMTNLDRTLQNIWEALRRVVLEVQESLNAKVPGV
jgi:hypothetical protein